MDLGAVRLYLRGRLNLGLAALLNRSSRESPPSLPLEAVAGQARPSPLDYVRLLEGRSNLDRQKLLGRVLEARGFTVSRHPYATFEGSGENFVVEVGRGARTLILVAHHDAVPGSPGANDNGSAIAILLDLLERLAQDPPGHLSVRLLFTGSEEIGYLGARCYVKAAPLDGVVGVVSLELCGIGDALVIWDAVPLWDHSPLLQTFVQTLEALGYRRDQTYHVVGRIPVFGSDHRAFSGLGVPAVGLTVVPSHEADALRQFVLNPIRTLFRQLVRRPPPFETYHTALDRSSTLDPAALTRVSEALWALVRALD
ncbi:MAG: M28 family metallopeptidase [Candidatus Methylomirabilia bacterium]